MIRILREVRALREAGKIHRSLIRRTQILGGIAIIMLGICAYNVIFRDTNAIAVVGLGVIGFLLGFVVFARMSPINWDEEKSTVMTQRMDVLGFVVLALYIGFDIGLRTYLESAYPVAGLTLVLATIGGSLLGRASGTILEIHRVYEARA